MVIYFSPKSIQQCGYSVCLMLAKLRRNMDTVDFEIILKQCQGLDLILDICESFVSRPTVNSNVYNCIFHL